MYDLVALGWWIDFMRVVGGMNMAGCVGIRVGKLMHVNGIAGTLV